MKSLILMAALAIAANSFASAAIAAPNRETEPAANEAVSYSDLDLRSAADQRRLKHRISFAAYRLCLVDSPASPTAAIADPVCFRAALKGAREQMDRAVARASGSSIMSASAASEGVADKR